MKKSAIAVMINDPPTVVKCSFKEANEDNFVFGNHMCVICKLYAHMINNIVFLHSL